jgi:hypothetical protein
LVLGRFLSPSTTAEAFSDDYPKIVGSFNQVERDIIMVTETHIDLRTNPYETED